LEEDYAQAAMYQSFRSIASYIDGMKPSSRKVVHVVKKNNVSKDTKVSHLAAEIAKQTEYLHGEASLQGVVVNMAQDFTGSNNMNLLYPASSFGTRFIPSASAARYIYTRKSEFFDVMFPKDDDEILDQQEFEGTIIEPKFFVPTLPMILVNGSEGIGTGYAQKILPRNPKTISKIIKDSLEGKKLPKRIKPYYRGFKGSITPVDNSWITSGKLTVKNTSTIEVSEVPINYTLASYTKVLNDLVEKRVIRDFTDLSEDDNFLFEIKTSRTFTSDNDEDKMMDIFKLNRRVTENFTCINENNAIEELNSEIEIIEKFIKIRLEYMSKRKDNLIKKMTESQEEIEGKLLFIEAVIKGELIISNRRKIDIETDIATKLPTVKKINGKFDYLLNMRIFSLTKEKWEELKKEYDNQVKTLRDLKKKSVKDLWLEDINNVGY
jgi:DNA topoisomerase-2